jgi:hypothetical protein
VKTTELVVARNVDLQWALSLQPAYTDRVGLAYQQPGDIAPRGTGLAVGAPQE